MREKTLGIIMLDTKFPRIVGDIGNDDTFDCKTIKKTVTNADPAAVVTRGDEDLLTPFKDAAKELESLGVDAITTSCGFLAMFQREIAASVSVPVFTSALLFVPTLAAMLPVGRTLGIMTADSTKLSARHFDGVGIKTPPSAIFGMQGTHFHDIFVGNSPSLDIHRAEDDMVRVANEMIKKYPEIGSILFECTNMPPYAEAVENATGRRVYGITDLARSII